MIEAHSANIVEPKTPAKTIPTLAEFIAGISDNMIAAASDTRARALEAEIDRVCELAGPCFDDMLTLFAYARGCHAVSSDRYLNADNGNGIRFQFLGQMCLDRALAIMGEVASQGIADGQVVTH